MADVHSGLQLLFDPRPDQEPKIKIGWCVSPDLLDEVLEEHDKYDLHVAVSVIDEKNRERRYVYPLAQESAWLYFFRPALHEIHATLIAGKRKDVHDMFLSEHRGAGLFKGFKSGYLWNGELEEGVWKNFLPNDIKIKISNLEEEITRLNNVILVECDQVLNETPEEAVKVKVESVSETFSDTHEITPIEAQILECEKTLVSLMQKRLDEQHDQVVIELEARKEAARVKKASAIEEREEIQSKIEVLKNDDYGPGHRELSVVRMNERYSYVRCSSKIEYFGHCRRDIEIADGYFAKEYPTWVKKWINFGFKDKLIDECHRRKRLIYAFTLKPFVVTVQAMSIVLWRALLIFWYKIFLTRPGVRVSPLFHPFSQVSGTITIDMERYSQFTHEDRHAEKEYFTALFLLSPRVVLSVAFLTMVYGIVANIFPVISFNPEGISVFASVAAAIFGSLAVGITYFIFLFVSTYVCTLMYSKWQDMTQKRKEKRRQESENETYCTVTSKKPKWRPFKAFGKWIDSLFAPFFQWLHDVIKTYENRRVERAAQMRERERIALQALVCDKEALIRGVSQQQPTFTQVVRRAPMTVVPKLLLQEAKAMVCRPFAE